MVSDSSIFKTSAADISVCNPSLSNNMTNNAITSIRRVQDSTYPSNRCPKDRKLYHEILFDFKPDGTHALEYYSGAPGASLLSGPMIRPEEEIRPEATEKEINLRMKLRHLRFRPNAGYGLVIASPPLYTIEGRFVIRVTRALGLVCKQERLAPSPQEGTRHPLYGDLRRYCRRPATDCQLDRVVTVRAFQIPARAPCSRDERRKMVLDDWGTYSPEGVEEARSEIERWLRGHALMGDNRCTHVEIGGAMSEVLADGAGLSCRAAQIVDYTTVREDRGSIDAIIRGLDVAPHTWDEPLFQRLECSTTMEERLPLDFRTEEENAAWDARALVPLEQRRRDVARAREVVRAALFVAGRLVDAGLLEKQSVITLDRDVTAITQYDRVGDCEYCGGAHDGDICAYKFTRNMANWVVSGTEIEELRLEIEGEVLREGRNTGLRLSLP